MPRERPQLAEYNSRHGDQAAHVSSEGAGRDGESGPYRLESSCAGFKLTSQGDLSVNVWLPGPLVFGEQGWIGIGRPVQVGGSVLGVDPRVCERVRVCHGVCARPDLRTAAGQRRAGDGDLTAVDSDGCWAGPVLNAC